MSSCKEERLPRMRVVAQLEGQSHVRSLLWAALNASRKPTHWRAAFAPLHAATEMEVKEEPIWCLRARSGVNARARVDNG